MRIALLGSLQVNDGHTTLGPRDRIVLQALASRPGTELSPEGLAEALWGEHLPETWLKVVQGCIVRLRKALGPDSIQTSPSGYRLVVHQDEVDHLHFEHLLARARELLANGEPERALYVTGQALELWRGEPLVELVDWAPGRVESERLVELWRDAEDLHAEASLRAGRYHDVLGDALRMVAEQPTRERRWGLLALAQYQAGRQGDALQTLHRAKTTLVNELGLDPGPELSELEQAILRQDPSLAAQTVMPPTSTQCPYLGLVGYDVDDAPAFFGRQTDISACLRRLDEDGVLAVLGPSGCGKSSLARAGVAAALKRDGRRVRVFSPGHHPTDALAATNPRATDVLVVDQCEEALALDPDSAERAEFFDQLVAFRARGRGVLVIALRADRLGELSTHPEFARLVERGLYLLGAMTEPDLRLAIEGPAAQAGLRLEPGLVDLLVREVEGEPAALPLLSHVLRQTWKRREGQTLTVAGYAATGGIREAISQSAEGVFRDLTADQQAILRDLMLRLVAPDGVGEPVRQRVPRRSVASDEGHSLLIERLVAARLLSTDGETVEIAHEALAMAWPRLRSWLDDDVDGLRIMRHLSVAATSWDDLGRPDSELYRGVRQARAVEWHDRAQPSLPPAEQDFLAASGALADKEQQATEAQVDRERRLNQRLRLGLAGVAALLAVSIVAGALAFTARDRADQQAVAADARRLGAEALRADDLDRSLLLAAAGVRLHDSVDTRTNLLATLDRSHQLVRTHRTETLFGLTVNNATGQVGLAMPGHGVTLFDGATLAEVHREPAIRGPGLVATRDGRTYAASLTSNATGGPSDPPAVQLLDQNGARSPTQLGGMPAKRHVHEMSFSPNGRFLVLTLPHREDAEPPVTGVWDLQAPRRPTALMQLGYEVLAPVVSNDGHTLYSTWENQLRVTAIPSGAQRRLSAKDLDVREVGTSLALSPDGRSLAVASGSEVALVHTANLSTRRVLGVRGGTDTVAFSRDGQRLAALGENLVAWDLTGDEPVELLRHTGAAGASLAFSPDAHTLYTAEQRGLLLAWDLDGDRGFLRKRPGDDLSREDDAPVMRFSPDRRKIAYVWGYPPAVQVRDVATGRVQPLMEIGLPQRSWIDLAWSPDGTMLNVTTGDSEVGVWDAATGRKLASRTLVQPAGSSIGDGEPAEGASIAFWSLDGKYLLVGTTSGRLHVLDGRTLQPQSGPVQVTTAKEGKPQAVGGLEPRHDLRTVVTYAYADRTQVVDYVEGVIKAPLDFGGEAPVVSYAPRGDAVLVETTDGGVGLRDDRRQQWISPPAAIPPFPGFIVGWSPDGIRVATASEGKVGWWDAGTFQGSASVPDAMSVAFSDDGQQLLVADAGGGVYAWDLDPATWVEAACSAAGRHLSEAEWRNYLPDREFSPVCAS